MAGVQKFSRTRRLVGLIAGQLASAEWWEARGLAVPRAPPDTALTDVVRDLFAAMALPPSFGGGAFGSAGGGLSSLGTGAADALHHCAIR